MTIAHEYAHVDLHAHAYAKEGNLRYSSTPETALADSWMERDASFFAAALLMPQYDVMQTINEFEDFIRTRRIPYRIEALVGVGASKFATSVEAVEIRLREMHVFVPNIDRKEPLRHVSSYERLLHDVGLVELAEAWQ